MGNICVRGRHAAGQARGLCQICADDYKQYNKTGKHNGEAPIQWAVERSHIYCVKALIESGADVNSSDLAAALMQAVSDGDDECVQVLLHVGAGVNSTDRNGDTALILAAKKGYVECLNLLVNAGANVNKRNRNGSTALMETTKLGQTKCVDALIKAGADVNLKSDSGDTPLIMATDLSNAYEILKLLVDAGADVNITDSDGNTALLSTMGLVDNTSIRQQVKLLLRAGAKINVFNIRNRNAIHQYVHSCNMWYHSPDRTMVLSLFVAGESTAGIKMEYGLDIEPGVTDNQGQPTISLKHTCRETIRNYLLKLDNHENLFIRVPRLGVPDSVSEYLLYNISI